MVTRDLIVMRHTLVHLGKLTLQFSRCPVKHHQHRRRPECPAATILDTDCKPGHLATGAAVQAAHGPDIIVTQEAHDQVALSKQVAPFFR